MALDLSSLQKAVDSLERAVNVSLVVAKEIANTDQIEQPFVLSMTPKCY